MSKTQCCKVCRNLKTKFVETGTIEVAVPSCPHKCFTKYQYVDAWGKIVELNYSPDDQIARDEIVRRLGLVELSGKLYRPKDSFDEYSTKETPRSVEKLLEITGFETIEVPQLTEEEQKELMSEANGEKEPLWAMSIDEYDEYMMELADDDIEPEDQPWHEFTLGNRNGVYYEYVGTFWDAFFEPQLWNSYCNHGIHKWTGALFTDEFDENRINVSPVIVRNVAKVFYGQLKIKETSDELSHCEACGLPSDGGLCPFCSGEDTEDYKKRAIGLLSSLDANTVVAMSGSYKDVAYKLDAEELVKFINE